MHCTAIIPARFESSRLPGKPLAMIGDRTMIEHVYQQTCKARCIDAVYVATDDQRIFAHCTNAGIPIFMTSEHHVNGTSRVIEVTKKLKTDYIVNVQGDEPFIQPSILNALVDRVKEIDSIATLVCPIVSLQNLKNPNVVKVVASNDDKALYFSRSAIPYSSTDTIDGALRHLGVYAFRKDILLELENLAQSNLAITESLEQLTWLQNGYTIAILRTPEAGHSVDTPEDLEKANQIWNQLNRR